MKAICVVTRRAAVLAALLLAGCGGGAQRSQPGLDAEGCGSSGLRVPVSQVVLDSAALSARMRTLLDGHAVPDTVSLLVQQRPDSTLVAARAAHGFDAELADRLEAAVIAELLPPEGEHGLPPYRIVYSPADGAVSLGRVRMCQPELLNRDELVAAMRRAARSMRTDAVAVVLTSVDPTGAVVAVRLVRESGDANVDAMALAIGGLARYRPARWDDVPVRAAVALPVQFVVRN